MTKPAAVWFAPGVLASVVAAGAPGTAGPQLAELGFSLKGPAEVTVAFEASCGRCSWQETGREGAALALFVDGAYSQHVILTRGEGAAELGAVLGPLAAGDHRLEVRLDSNGTPRAVTGVSVARLAAHPVAPEDPEQRALAFSPILLARPNSIGRFTDVPLVMWYETDATPRGVRYRYSVIFSNEDGGTPPDRLMATWGRLTDIEYVYGVELDSAGRILEETYQGPGHRIVPFQGRRLGRHPYLYVVTDNNMVSDHGETRQAYALRPVAFDLANASREAVMDALPWTYRVSVQEARREGRVLESALPGSDRLPDPRRFLTLEACAEAQDATLSFGVGVRGADGGIDWLDSDGGLPRFRIARSPDHFPNGCFRGAVALPAGVAPERVVSLRFRAFARLPEQGERAAASSGSARVVRVNKLFFLGEDDMPAASLFAWRGVLAVTLDGLPAELSIPPRDARR